MKKALIVMACLAFISSPFCLKAQDEKTENKEKTGIEEKIEKKEKIKTREKPEKKESQEIVIRNKAGKDLNLKIEIKGDKVTVNGKPLDEFKDDGVTINNRKMIIRDGDGIMSYNFGPDGMNFSKDFMGQWGAVKK